MSCSYYLSLNGVFFGDVLFLLSLFEQCFIFVLSCSYYLSLNGVLFCDVLFLLSLFEQCFIFVMSYSYYLSLNGVLSYLYIAPNSLCLTGMVNGYRKNSLAA